jgi:hypothetical protein
MTPPPPLGRRRRHFDFVPEMMLVVVSLKGMSQIPDTKDKYPSREEVLVLRTVLWTLPSRLLLHCDCISYYS